MAGKALFCLRSCHAHQIMKKIARIYMPVFIMLAVACKKDDPAANPPGPDDCSWKKLTSVKTSSQGIAYITYDQDGNISYPNSSLRYFNNKQLIEFVGSTDTVVLDSIGRLKYLKIPFDFDGKRQTRYYFYDDENRVIRTLTHTGNGIDYWAHLVYENGDVVAMSYSITNPATSSTRFRFTYYDTICTDQFPGMQSWGQIGMTQNRHLMKTSDYSGDSTHYAYKLDSNMRVLVSYRNYDNSTWTYARAEDTTYYFYTCP